MEVIACDQLGWLGASYLDRLEQPGPAAWRGEDPEEPDIVIAADVQRADVDATSVANRDLPLEQTARNGCTLLTAQLERGSFGTPMFRRRIDIGIDPTADSNRRWHPAPIGR